MKQLARLCYRRRRSVLVAWVVLIIALFGVSNALGGEFKTEFKLPGSESQAALDILKNAGFSDRTGVQAQIVFEADQGVDDPAVRQAMDKLFSQIESDVPESSLVSPYTEAGARQIAEGGKIAYAELNLAERSQEEYVAAGDQIKAMRQQVSAPGLRIELGGDMFAAQSMPAKRTERPAVLMLSTTASSGTMPSRRPWR